MSKRIEQEFIVDILVAIERILFYAAQMDYDLFLKDFKTQDAIVRNLEIIGEATKSLSENFIQQYPGIPWKNIAGMRDKLIHDYFGVNIDIVWDVVSRELPQLKAQLAEILKHA